MRGKSKQGQSWLGGVLGSLVLVALAGCGGGNAVATRTIPIHQNWALQPGSEIAGYRVIGSLGDVSIELDGYPVRAPFDGRVEPLDGGGGCVVFSTPEVPAYLFRLCGLANPALGDLRRGDKIGKGQSLQFAAMRKQPDGTWAIVEPALDILERTVKQP
ncbi:MAG: hypothetical protein AAF215_04070 [Cyanobacteria bacterium P01_A01_bin.123]